MTDSTKNIYSAQKSAGGKLVENENVVIGNVSFIIHSNIFTENLWYNSSLCLVLRFLVIY